MAVVSYNKFDIFLVSLDPTIGGEIKKTRPCLIISPNELNKYLSTVIVAPLNTKTHDYPFRLECKIAGKASQIIFDQIRTVDKKRLVKYISCLDSELAKSANNMLLELFK